MKYDSKTKTMDYTKKEKEHVFSSFPKGKSTPRSKALKGGHKQGEREARSKKAGFYVAGHKNYGDVYEA